MESNTIYLSTGRSCIREILSKLYVAEKRAIVPAFTCESVVEPFIEAGYTIQPYSVNEDLTVDLSKLKQQIGDLKPTVILFHRYFGFDTCKEIEKYITQPGIITIEDETQFMFSEPRQTWTDYQIGSIRKWGAFPDGAYLKSNHQVIEQPKKEDADFIELEEKAMTMKQAFLSKESTDTSYLQAFDEGRKYIDEQKNTYSISGKTNHALEALDVTGFINSHRSNAKILIEGLQGYSLVRLYI